MSVAGDVVPEVPSAAHNFAQPWTQSTLEDTVGVARAEYDFLPNWTAYASGGVRRSHEDGTYSSPTFNAATGTTATRGDVLRTTDALAAQIGVRGHFSTGPVTHQVAAGLAITSLEDREAFAFSGAFPTSLYGGGIVPEPAATGFVAGSFSDPGLADRILTRSVAVSDTLGLLNDRVLFTIGARHQQLRQNNYTVGTDTISSTFNQSITTPIFGLVVKPTDTISLFANRAESLAAGQIAPFGAANVGQTLSPNRTKQYEVGAKYDTKQFGGEIALFQLEQPTAYTDSATNLFGRNGTQRHRGIELSVYGEPVRGVRLLAGATLLNAKQLDTNGGATDGYRPVGVPSYLFNVSGEYDLPWVPGLTVNAAWIHTGNQYLDAANKLDSGMEPLRHRRALHDDRVQAHHDVPRDARKRRKPRLLVVDDGRLPDSGQAAHVPDVADDGLLTRAVEPDAVGASLRYASGCRAPHPRIRGRADGRDDIDRQRAAVMARPPKRRRKQPAGDARQRDRGRRDHGQQQQLDGCARRAAHECPRDAPDKHDVVDRRVPRVHVRGLAAQPFRRDDAR